MFLGYIHSYRALAISFIVFGHAIDAFVWPDDPFAERWLRIWISNGSTLFVFIAGYLFQHLSPSYKTQKYYIAKLKNVLLPYLLVSIPALALFVGVMERDMNWVGFYDYEAWQQALLFLVTGKHLAPYWFIPMITIFYAAAPLLVLADKHPKSYLLLPVLMLVSLNISRGMPYHSFAHFVSIYVLGMCCSHYKVILNPVLEKTTVILPLLAIACLFAYIEFAYTTGTMTRFNYLQKFAMCLFWLGLLSRLKEVVSGKFVSLLADTSFGIFFIHSYLLSAGKIAFAQLNGHPANGNLFLYPMIALVTLMVCMFVVWVVQRVFGRYSRMLVGS